MVFVCDIFCEHYMEHTYLPFNKNNEWNSNAKSDILRLYRQYSIIETLNIL